MPESEIEMFDPKKLTEPLKSEDIELRVGRITEYQGNYTMHLLAYKTSRIDVVRLNEACTPLGWQCKYHYDAKDYLCCSIGVFDKENNQWVWKSDVGTESNTEKEKGSYSDALKRAGYRWGIGIELYKLKGLKVALEAKDVSSKQVGQKTVHSYKWGLADWHLHFDTDGTTHIVDNFGNIRSGKGKSKPKPTNFNKEMLDKCEWSGIIKNNTVYLDQKKYVLSDGQANQCREHKKYLEG